MKKTAINRAKDFKDFDIEVELIPLGNQVFNRETFYEVFIQYVFSLSVFS
jgi:hypothetical protein